MDVVLEGFGYAEGLRWRYGALWFSDMARGEVHRIDAAGDHVVADGLTTPSGTGFDDGRLSHAGRGGAGRRPS